MKTIKEYIIRNLKLIHGEINGIELRYQYDPCSDMHIVEVTPIDIYNESKKYIKWEIEFTDAFEQEFPGETIFFVSEESLTRVTSPEFTLSSVKFNVNDDYKKRFNYRVAEFSSQYFEHNYEKLECLDSQEELALAA